MAKKSIILSNDDGRVTFSDTGSLWIEDTNFSVTGSQIAAGTLKIANVQADKLPFVSGSSKIISSVVTGTVTSGALAWSATTNQWSASADIVESYTGSAGGHLSGTFGSAEGVKVINISNVNSGTLPAGYGGTGANIPVGSNILLVAKSGSYSYLSASAASSGSVVTCTSNGWAIAPPAYLPDIRFYTASSNTTTNYTWTKPAGARFARVILQGAGGGGGGGAAATYGGAGGGSGGFTDIILDVSSLSSEIVIVGGRGTGGATANTGTSGNTTFFGTYYAGGGGGGGAGANSSTNRGSGGTGLTKNGGMGASTNTNPAETVYSMPSGGGNGVSLISAGTIVNILSPNNKNFGYNITTDGITINTTIAQGGAGGNPGAAGGLGAGGGGGAVAAAGGPGGNGYALIISW